MDQPVELVKYAEEQALGAAAPLRKNRFAISSLLGALDEVDRIARQILAVRIHHDDRVEVQMGVGVAKAHCDGALMSEILPELQHVHGLKRGIASFHEVDRSRIGRGVVHDQHVRLKTGLPQILIEQPENRLGGWPVVVAKGEDYDFQWDEPQMPTENHPFQGTPKLKCRGSPLPGLLVDGRWFHADSECGAYD